MLEGCASGSKDANESGGQYENNSITQIGNSFTESDDVNTENDNSGENGENEMGSNDLSTEKKLIIPEIENYADNLKKRGDTNPIMTQDFGADPYVLVYDGVIYIYMTADTVEYDSDGAVIENTYGNIRSIHVVSTTDMKNFTDCGEIPVAGKDGIATWANNSWAPAAAYKNIDGQDKFFLYFADNGGGIGVLCADSPTGPFTDPLGHGLITRQVATCDSVPWLFDPAVLVDDDGEAYIYFGGGVPEGQAEHPLSARVCKLGEDMISLDGEPVVIDAPYMFEDSGIHRCGDKYYYSYCTNWSVDSEGTSKYGITNGQIAYMVSDNPMGPFEFAGKILENPGKLCGLSSNNHHAIFSFGDDWYIVYHSRLLEKNMGIDGGYRATFINEVKYNEDGSIKLITQSTEGPEQLKYADPYTENSAVCVTKMGGTDAVPICNEISYGEGNMALGEIDTGDFIEVTGVDFGEKNSDGEGSEGLKLSVTVRFAEDVSKGDENTDNLNTDKNSNNDTVRAGAIYLRLDYLNSDNLAEIIVADKNDGDDFVTYTVQIDAEKAEAFAGIHYVYFVFAGEGFEIKSWKFEK